MEQIKNPFNLTSWLTDHERLLKPPVANKEIFPESEFVVMAVGGPNHRTDFHIDPSEELFYQIKGTLTLRLFINGDFKDIKVHPGESFHLPSLVPHSPQRPPDSLGLVIERRRHSGEKEGFAWYCPHCKTETYRETVELKNIETDMPLVFERFYQSENSTCKTCQFKFSKDA